MPFLQRNERKVAKTIYAENAWNHSQFMSFICHLRKNATMSLIIVKAISTIFVKINGSKNIFFAQCLEGNCKEIKSSYSNYLLKKQNQN